MVKKSWGRPADSRLEKVSDDHSEKFRGLEMSDENRKKEKYDKVPHREGDIRQEKELIQKEKTEENSRQKALDKLPPSKEILKKYTWSW